MNSTSIILTIDEYITRFPKEVQVILTKIREIIKVTAPQATEAMKYGIPTFIYKGNLVHFGGYKEHIGFYPTPGAILAFKTELSPYPQAKGSIRFALDKPIPYDLIKKIVLYRVKENDKKVFHH